jgi:acetyl esterase
MQASANPPEWPKSIIPRQDSYWRSEDNMREANPMLILERGETVLMPPAIWFQAVGDTLHDYKDPDSKGDLNEPQRFVENYKKAGGDIALIYFEGPRIAGHAADLSKMGSNFEQMIAFVRQHVPAA